MSRETRERGQRGRTIVNWCCVCVTRGFLSFGGWCGIYISAEYWRWSGVEVE